MVKTEDYGGFRRHRPSLMLLSSIYSLPSYVVAFVVKTEMYFGFVRNLRCFIFVVKTVTFDELSKQRKSLNAMM